MNQERTRSRFVPGRLSLGSLFLALTLFLAFDIVAYWSAGLIFRDLPSVKAPESELKSKMTELEGRLVGVEKSASGLKKGVEEVGNMVSINNRKLATLEKRIARLEHFGPTMTASKSR